MSIWFHRAAAAPGRSRRSVQNAAALVLAITAVYLGDRWDPNLTLRRLAIRCRNEAEVLVGRRRVPYSGATAAQVKVDIERRLRNSIQALRAAGTRRGPRILVEPGRPSRIQEAVDRLPTGGEVVLAEGVHVIDRPITLRDHVTLSGEKTARIVASQAPVTRRLRADVHVGALFVDVADPTGLLPGMQVSLGDSAQGGWFSTTSTIKKCEGYRIWLERPVLRAYTMAHEAELTTAYPAISGNGAGDLHIRNLTIGIPDADIPHRPYDFRQAAIALEDTENCSVSGTTVYGWPSDAISVQGGKNIRLEGNSIMKARGHGIHIGTSLATGFITGNTIRNSAGDGLYLCANVNNVLVANNNITGNQGAGVGGLGGEMERDNIIYDNRISDNRGAGVHVYDTGNTVAWNTFSGNTRRGIPCDAWFDLTATGNCVVGNVFSARRGN